jgi:hypothetical protein
VASLAEVLDPKDSALIAEALQEVNSVAEGRVPEFVKSTLESVAVKSEESLHTIQEILDDHILETEPSLVASPPEVPVLQVPGVPA